MLSLTEVMEWMQENIAESVLRNLAMCNIAGTSSIYMIVIDGIINDEIITAKKKVKEYNNSIGFLYGVPDPTNGPNSDIALAMTFFNRAMRNISGTAIDYSTVIGTKRFSEDMFTGIRSPISVGYYLKKAVTQEQKEDFLIDMKISYELTDSFERFMVFWTDGTFDIVECNPQLRTVKNPIPQGIKNLLESLRNPLENEDEEGRPPMSFSEFMKRFRESYDKDEPLFSDTKSNKTPPKMSPITEKFTQNLNMKLGDANSLEDILKAMDETEG